jgi:hypothetical protein
MNNLDPVALDRWITGNYGEDQSSDDDPDETEMGDCPTCGAESGYPCGHPIYPQEGATEAEWRYDHNEDRIREDAHLEMAYEDRFYIGDADLDM